MNKFVCGCLNALLIFMLVSVAHAERLLDPMPRTMKAKNFTLPNTQGEDVSLTDFEGKFVLVNFWSTECTICRAELTTMQDLYDQMSNDGRLEIIAIHAGSDVQGVLEQMEINPVTYSMLIDTDLQMGHWGIPTLPTSYLVTPNGSFAYRVLGVRVWNSPAMVDFLKRVFDDYENEKNQS